MDSVYSEGCEDPSDPERCSYRASWIVDYDLQVVNFTLSTTENGWVALGVSKTRTMVRLRDNANKIH